jgi:spermidine/putrescine transport system permease protein
MKRSSIRSVISQELPLFMSMPALLWQILFFYVPLLFILGLSFIKTTDISLLFTVDHYSALLHPIYAVIIGRSLVLALVTATVCLLCAYPVAYFLAFQVRRFKNIFLFSFILPFWISLLVQVYAWFFVLEKYGIINRILLYLGISNAPIVLLNTPFAVYLVMVYYYLPFMILPLYSTLEKLDRKLIEASLDLGASPLKTFLRITLPLSVPGIRTGFFLVFVPSFGEFVIPGLMGGAKQYYVGSLILHYFLISRQPFMGAAFTCLSALALCTIVFIIYRYFRRLTRLPRKNSNVIIS